MVDISSRGIQMIKHFEGAKVLMPDGRYKSYLDTLAKPHVWTVYTGLTKGVNKDTIWTEDECERRFARELSIYEDAIDSVVKVPLNQNQADACISLVYNIGPGAFAKSTLLKLLNQGKYELAAAQFAKWNKAGGKVWPGLVRRRAAEAALFLEPMPDEHVEHVPVKDGNGSTVLIPTNTMPQRVEPNQPTTVEVVKNSGTAKFSIFGSILLAAQQAWNWAFGVFKEAGPEITGNQDALSPLSALLKAVGANMDLLLALVVFGTLIGIVIHKVQQEKA